MENIKIDLGFATLVAERGTDTNYNEIFIWLEDKNGVCIQDLAIVGQQYHYDEDLDVVQDEGLVVRVYADENNEDHTHQFRIGVYKEEE
jgi:hypothetical protein